LGEGVNLQNYIHFLLRVVKTGLLGYDTVCSLIDNSQRFGGTVRHTV